MATSPTFEFTAENFASPQLPHGLQVVDVPLLEATDENLEGFGYVIHSPDERTVENGNFEIVPWPTTGWRTLDPDTGDEAGTTEGDFEVHWSGDYFHGKNLAIATTSNTYLDGLGTVPEQANPVEPANGDGSSIFLWMSDYHPDGGQLFWPRQPIPFIACLGPRAVGDDVKPSDMRAFAVPAGKGVYLLRYFHPGTWHNGVYIEKQYSPATFLTRQGRVHARVSASWAVEFGQILRVPLRLS